MIEKLIKLMTTRGLLVFHNKGLDMVPKSLKEIFGLFVLALTFIFVPMILGGSQAFAQSISTINNLTATVISSSSINLSWSPSTDNGGGVDVGYYVYRDGSLIGTTTTGAYNDTGLSELTIYSYTVEAYDELGNTSAVSNNASAQTWPNPPTVPSTPIAGALSSSHINISYGGSTSDLAVAGYKIYRNGVLIATTTTSGGTIADTGLSPNSTYTYTDSAYDMYNQNSPMSPAVSATTQANPTVPTSLVATAVSSSQINLTWATSTDPAGVTGYNVYRNGTQVATSTTTSYSNTGLKASTLYSYTVSAYDAAGNNSAQCTSVSATTQAAADTTPPSVPTGLAATVISSSQINLSWTASTDNVGVTGYKIYRNGTQVATSTTTSYSNTGLTASTLYSYTVSAYDAAGNNSAQCTSVSATTQAAADTTPPSVPTGLAATVISSSQINLSWTASTDNVGVTGYKIYRNGTQVATSTTTSYSNTGLTASTLYSYTVSAYDAAGNNSAQCTSVSATTQAAADTTPPSVPTGLAATVISSSQINLSWTASTDNVGVTGYKIYRNGTQVATSTTTSYSNTGLTASTLYSYTVSAYDAAGNNSAQCASVSATTQAAADSTPPSVPTGLAATVISSSQINLSWTASTDNVGVTGYKIYRNGTQVATSTTTSYSNTGLTASTLYSYTVSAYDAAGNNSAQCTSVSATTQAAADTTPPSVPTGLAATVISSSQINLSWTASTDNVGVTGYKIYRNGTQVATSTTTSYSNTGLTASTLYSYTVSAYDAAGNNSAQCTSVSATTQAAADTTPPSVPTGLAATVISSSQINLSWTASTDNVGVTGYKIYRNGTQVATSTTTSYSNTGLTASTLYSYTVSAYDAAGNNSAQCTSVSATTQAAADTTPPSVPTGLAATVISSSQINLSWTASTDNVGVTGYKIYRNGTQVATSTTTSYSNTGLTASTLYSYTVSAYDAAGNNSAQCASVSATTQAASSATAPSVPVGVVATAISTSQINLTWWASTDNVGVFAGYKIYRNGSQIGISTTTSYSDSGLMPSTQYTYTVSAYDTAGNNSAQSAPTSVTTQAPYSGPWDGLANSIKTAYNLNAIPLTGSGQTIILFQMGGYSPKDINWWIANQVPEYTGTLSNIYIDGFAGTPYYDIPYGLNPDYCPSCEVTLDIETVMGMAPASNILVYESDIINNANAWIDTWNQIASDNKASIVSCSWGTGAEIEGNAYIAFDTAIFQQMAAQGQAVFTAAGDAGAFPAGTQSTTPTVNEPPAQPYVTAVGISNLTTNSNGTYNNETASKMGGGGISEFQPIPLYQVAVSAKALPAAMISTTMRNVPDVVMNADYTSEYYFYINGDGYFNAGGASTATPIWASFMALVNQGLAQKGLGPLGFANPALYQIAQTANYANDFHDITTGNNSGLNGGTGYYAEPGFDDATGLGSFNGLNLYNDLVTSSCPATPPSPPLDGQASLGKLSWVKSPCAASYNVLRATSNVGPYTTIASSVTSIPYTDTTIAYSTPYYYVIQAVNSYGTSVNSSVILAAGICVSNANCNASQTCGGGGIPNECGYWSTTTAGPTPATVENCSILLYDTYAMEYTCNAPLGSQCYSPYAQSYYSNGGTFYYITPDDVQCSQTCSSGETPGGGGDGEYCGAWTTSSSFCSTNPSGGSTVNNAYICNGICRSTYATGFSQPYTNGQTFTYYSTTPCSPAPASGTWSTSPAFCSANANGGCTINNAYVCNGSCSSSYVTGSPVTYKTGQGFTYFSPTSCPCA